MAGGFSIVAVDSTGVKKQAMPTVGIACLAKTFLVLEALLRSGNDLILKTLVQVDKVGAITSDPHH